MCNLEPRNYRKNNRFKISNERYKCDSRFVNRFLEQFKKSRGFSTINLTSEVFKILKKADGVHFTKEGYGKLSVKIHNTIVL